MDPAPLIPAEINFAEMSQALIDAINAHLQHQPAQQQQQQQQNAAPAC